MLNICHTDTPMIDREVGRCKPMALLLVLVHFASRRWDSIKVEPEPEAVAEGESTS